jgi:hypothetical protein
LHYLKHGKPPALGHGCEGWSPSTNVRRLVSGFLAGFGAGLL